MKEVSVIVPVYNVERYLKECVESIVNQNYTQIKVILVNDGSTDGSLAVCKELQHTYSNVLVIDKPNGGVSSARNAGLDAADTELVSFADSDDVLAVSLYSTLISEMEKTDTDRAAGGYYHLYEDGHTIVRKTRIPDGVYSSEILLKEMIDDGSLSGFLFSGVNNSVYKRDILVKNNIRFRSHIRYNEDSLFNLEYALVTRSMVSLRSQPLYYYRQHSTSATSTRKPGDKYADLRETLQQLNQEYKIPDFDLQMKRRSVTEALWQVMDITRAYSFGKGRKEIAATIKARQVRDGIKYISKDKLNIYKKFFYYLIKFRSALGIYLSCRYLLPKMSKHVSR